MNKPAISAPWYTYQKKLAAFFDYDEDVSVGELEESGEGEYSITVSTRDPGKAYALQCILVQMVCFGSVAVKVYVELEDCDILRRVFAGNMAVRDIVSKAIPGGEQRFVRLEPEVIQFPNDDASSYDGQTTILIQDVAREIFDLFPLQATACTIDIKEYD